ncbi:MAG: hypothetical protein JWR81_3810, partial [Pseudonocardia sp.]|nr:hypothetical protein [Pseudonocardia sp.]MDT7618562.1 hypothetical protein [Pseudonocardiales bacterium]
ADKKTLNTFALGIVWASSQQHERTAEN